MIPIYQIQKPSSERSSGTHIQTKIRKQIGLRITKAHSLFSTSCCLTRAFRSNRRDPPRACIYNLRPQLPGHATHQPVTGGSLTQRPGGKGRCHRKCPRRRPGPMSIPWPPRSALSLGTMPAKEQSVNLLQWPPPDGARWWKSRRWTPGRRIACV